MALSDPQKSLSNNFNPPALGKKLPPLIPRRPAKDPHAAQTSEPPPSTPPLPTPIDNIQSHQFTTPVRRIISPHDHELFLASDSYTLLLAWIFGLSDSVRGLTVSDITKAKERYHPTIKIILGILEEAKDLLKEYPPEDTGSRFGNKVFRDYMGAIEQKSKIWHERFYIGAGNEEGVNKSSTIPLPSEATIELSTYLTNSFGSPSRLDYGSGHELNFACWLLCLHRLGLFTPPPTSSPTTTTFTPSSHTHTVPPTHQTPLSTITLAIFPSYWSLMRQVQGTYYLEPAGSHGVWGLDDYQFLPFLFGASQFVTAPSTTTPSSSSSSSSSATTTTLQNPRRTPTFLTPKAIHSPLLLDDYSSEYIYLAQVQHINSVKTVEGLRWHSPMLDDISAAKNWGKIEGGMKKMFVKEVLGKRAVMQHFLFGELIPAVEGMSPAVGGAGEGCEDGDGHVHVHDHDHDKGLSDACGIRVPGAVGAAIEARKHGGQGALRRLPFD